MRGGRKTATKSTAGTHGALAWTVDAACQMTGDQERDGAILDAFAENATDRKNFARRFCRACPVQRECGAYANGAGEEYGVWGGKAREYR